MAGFGKYDSEFSALKALAFAVGCTTPDGGWDSSYSIMSSMYEHLVGSAPAENADLGTMVAAISGGVESGEITVSYDCINEIERLNIVINEKNIHIENLNKKLEEGGGQGVLDSALESIGITPENNGYYFSAMLNAVDTAKQIKDNWIVDTMCINYAGNPYLRFMPWVDTSNVTDTQNAFAYTPLEVMPSLNLSKVQRANAMFSSCINIGLLPDFEFSDEHLVEIGSMLQGCKNLQLIPNITGTKNVYNFSYLYQGCTMAGQFPYIDTSSAEQCIYMYADTQASQYPNLTVKDGCMCDGMYMACINMVTPPKITGKITGAGFMYQGSAVNEFNHTIEFYPEPYVDSIGNMLIPNASSMFANCFNLTKAPKMITNSVISVYEIFNGCQNLQSIPDYNLSSVNDEWGIKMFGDWGMPMENLTDLEGFTGLHVGWSGGFLDKCPNLTVDSLMNVINKLEDVNDNPQNFYISDVNVAKLTPEQIAIATNKGWVVY